jgi:hypothetical protein
MDTAAQEALAQAAEHLDDSQLLIDARLALLQHEPADPAQAYFRLAKAYRPLGDLEKARRYVLMALEEAPRFRDAQRMLLELRALDAVPTEIAPSSTGISPPPAVVPGGQ